jgi:ADP-heptose:LPS heptosyltransferase
MKILILRFSSIGDIILTTPVIRCLKQQVPNVIVHFATKKSFAGFMGNNPYVDKLHLLDNSANEFIKTLKAENYDYIFDLHNNLRTLKIKLALGWGKSYSFNKLNFKKWLWTNLKLNRMPAVHIVDRYMDTTKILQVQNDQQGLDYFIPQSDIITPKDWGIPTEYNVYCIGGQHATKKLPQAKMRDLVKNLSLPLVLLGGLEDVPEGNALTKYCEENFPNKIIVNLCGICNLNQSASVAQQANMVYTHDTGMMHIAAALKKPVVALWGNTHPGLGMYPYKTEHWNIQNNTINCRPCSKIGYKQCPKKHFNCMNDLDFSQLPTASRQP